MKNLFRYAIVACLLFISTKSFSTHLMGGNLTYSFVSYNIGSNTYTYNIELRIYRYCTGATSGLSLQENLGVYNENPLSPNASKILAGTFIIPLAKSTFITPPSPNPNCTVGANVCVEEGVYTTSITVNASTGGYHLMVDRCCRNNNIANLSNPGGTGQTYYAFIPPTGTQNNAATFATAPVPFICAGDTTSILNTAFDADGDSLSYSFVTPYWGISDQNTPVPNPPAIYTWPIRTVTYAGGYSFSSPFGVGGYTSINPLTGLTSYYSPNQGFYVVAVEIKEYRNGVLVGVTRRDLQIIVIPCPVNTTPSFNASVTTYKTEEGSNLCFTIDATDADGDSVFLSATGPVFTASPAANFSASNAAGSSSAQFCWPTSCEQGRATSYQFTAIATDNGCPAKTTNLVYTIFVNPTFISSITGPDTICSSASVSSIYAVSGVPGFTYSWTIQDGTQTAGGNTNSITVQWTGLTGEVSAYALNINSCHSDTVSKDVVAGNPVADAGADIIFCSGQSAMIGSASIPNQQYMWSPGSGLSDSTISNPTITLTNSDTVAAVTSYILTVSQPGCSATDTVEVTVNPLPIVTLSPFADVCIDQSAYALSGGSPAGGVYSGAGVSNGMFDPALAGIGTHTINYTYSTPTSTTVTFQPDAVSGKDGVVDSYYPLVDNSTIAEFNTVAWTHNGSSEIQRGFIDFNFTSIPPNAVIQSAHLTLYNNPNSINGFGNGQHSHLSGSNAALLQRVTSTWQENVNWTNQPSATSVNQVIIPQDTNPNQNYTLDVTLLVQDMINNPATSFGFMLKLQTEVNYRCLVFASSDHSNSSLHPKLEITYTTTSSTTTSLISCTDSASATITVNPLPSVSIGPIAGVCQSSDPVILNTGSPAGGIYSGTGVNNGMLSPSVAGTGTHTIIYTYSDSNACINADSTSVTVHANPTVTLSSFNAVCVDASPVVLSGGLPAGGIFSGTGVNNDKFMPAVAGVGTHSITYSYSDINSCADSAKQTITVNALPVVSIGSVGSFCSSDSPVILSSGSPLGGTYSGVGVSNGIFSPSVAGAGTHSLVYAYTDPNGCSGSDTTIVIVHSIPTVSFAPLNSVCVSANSFILSGGSPSGGSYHGNGVSNGMFDPSSAGVGNHVITYVYSDLNGCSDSAKTSIAVNALPVVSIGALSSLCTTSSPVTLSTGSPSGGIYSGTGVSNGIFNPSVSGAGTFTITYTYSDLNGCSGSANTSITVFSQPQVTLAPFNSTCLGSPAFALNGGSPTGGVYSGPGVQNGMFDAAVAGIGTHTITYTLAGSGGCVGSASSTISVFAAPTVSVSVSKGVGCKDNTIFVGYGPQSLTISATTNTPNVSYSWFKDGTLIQGQTSTTLQVTSAGVYTAMVTDINGCNSSLSNQASIASIHVVDIRCGHDLKKVVLCHVPPGNPSNPQTLCIAPSAIPAHLGNHPGDCLGPCPSQRYASPTEVIENLLFTSYPNPFIDQSLLEFTVFETGRLSIDLLDIQGKHIMMLFDSEVENDIAYRVSLDGGKFSAGVYLLKVRSENFNAYYKIIKAK